MTLMGFVERLFSLPVHIACAVLVVQVFTRRQIRWLGLAIGWHALVDAMAVILLPTYGVYVTESFIGLGALVSLGIIYALRQPEPAVLVEEPAPLPALIRLQEVDVTPETLEKTRFQ
jgi:uncharacterized membrane protein YhfC